jgi:4-amino-4-deoxy-L-arabinose transferase-like glycosyltransferase
MSPKRAGRIVDRRSDHRGTRPKRQPRGLAVVLSAVLLLKLLVMWQLKDHVLTQPDAGLDTTMPCRSPAVSSMATPRSGPGLYFVSPLYIYFLAGARRHRLLHRRAGAADPPGTAAVACVYLGACEWFGRRAAWIAAGLAALTGLFTFYESLLLQAALDPFLTAAGIAALAVGLRRGDDRGHLAAGIAFGAQILNRPNVAIAAGTIALCLAFTRHHRAAAVFAGALALAVVPLAARNLAVTGTWSAVSSHGGLNFYIGNHDRADGTYQPVPGITPNLEGQRDDARRVAERAEGRTLDDAAVSAYFYRRGWSWIRDQPAAAIRLFVRKLSLVFSSAEIWLNNSYRFFADDPRSLLRALFVGPAVLIPLGLVGLVLAAPKAMRLEYIVWASFVPVYAVAVALFFVADRYTLPLLIPLCASAGAAIDAFATMAASRRWTHLGMGAAAVVLSSQW